MKQKWLVCVAGNLPDFLARFHPHIRVAVREGGLSCLRVRLRTARRSRVHLTANVISPSPLLLLNDLAIVVSLLWHANHPRSLLRRAAEWTTQIKNFHFVLDKSSTSHGRCEKLLRPEDKPRSNFEKIDVLI